MAGQYIQHPQIARDFANYLELFYKYRTDYPINEVLNGRIDDILVKKAVHASFDREAERHRTSSFRAEQGVWNGPRGRRCACRCF